MSILETLGQDYLEETRDQARELLEALSRTNAAPEVGPIVRSLLDVLADDVADLSREALSPLCDALDRVLERHDVAPADRELSSVVLADLGALGEIARRLLDCLPVPPAADAEAPSDGQERPLVITGVVAEEAAGTVTIDTRGPVKMGRVWITVANDDYSDLIHVDPAAFAEAESQGPIAVLKLVFANCGEVGEAIVDGGVFRGSTILIDGIDIGPVPETLLDGHGSAPRP